MSNTPPVRATRPSRAGTLLRLLLLLALLVTALLAWLPVLLPQVLQQQGISLHWQGARWGLHGLELRQLQLEHEGQSLQASDVQLDWRWAGYPLQSLSIGELKLAAVLPKQNDTTATDGDNGLAALAPWLPQQLSIDSLEADIAGVGRIGGSLRVQTDAGRPLWQPARLELDFELTRLNPQWLDGIPPELQPEQLRIRTLTRPNSESAPDALQSLSLDIHSLGRSQAQLSGILNLYHDSGWRGTLEQARLHLELPRLELAGVPLEHLQTQLHFTATADERGFGLQLSQPATLTVNQLDADPQTRLQQVSVTLARLQLDGEWQTGGNISLEANYHAAAGQLQHPLLRAQGWNATGTLSGHLPDLQATAAVSNADGLQLNSNWLLQGNDLGGQVTLTDVFLRAGNPLQKTLPDWPALVEFDNGRLDGQASISLPAGKPLQVTGQLNGNGLGGIVNRSEMAGLDFTAFFRLDQGGQLRLDMPRLVVGELDPGVPVRQLTVLDGSYSGHLDHLLQGSASWSSIRGSLLGGEFSVKANRIRLDTDNRLQLQLAGIQLQDALALYPTEGLYGQATIDGSLPLLINSQGVFVEQGQLQARQPGTLRFQSEQIRSLGRANPGMQLVAEALDDFHFNVLSSKLDYEPSGKLLFNVRLEGKNPAVEQGRPIHLNLNLEEDLPALLASIQLSNHVSETIQELIRQRLQNR